MKVIEREKTVRQTAAGQIKAGRATAVGSGAQMPSRTTSGPSVQLRARAVTRPATRRGVNLSGVVSFGVMATATYLASTMFGYVMLESSRQNGRKAIERAAFARREAKAAREGIETLTNPAVLRDWAEAHGFQMDQAEAASPAPPKGTRVALR